MKDIKWERRETEWDKVNTSLDSGIHPSAPGKHTKLIRYMDRDSTMCILLSQRPLCWSRVLNIGNKEV